VETNSRLGQALDAGSGFAELLLGCCRAGCRDEADCAAKPGWTFLLLLGFLRGSDSRSSGLAMLAIMPVATRV
jgi:hypothetical protein